MAHRVLYYTLDGDLAHAREVLGRMGVSDEIELLGVAHGPFESPTAEQLEGVEALVGEFCPVRGEVVDRVARAGVRIVASMSIGVNHLDVAALAERGVVVTNCPGYCAPDVALHTLALMLDLMCKVTLTNRDVRAGGWNPKAGYPVRRPAGQTAGLVFFGRIAQEVAPLVQALGMHVMTWAPTKDAAFCEARGVELVEDLDELLRRSDVVSLHCPLIPETTGLIGRRELSLMKRTAFLVNTSRGEVIDEDALVRALENHVIQGAGLDVMCHESAGPSPRLISLDTCVVTPHRSYDTVEAAANLCEMSLESVVDLLVRGENPRWVVRP